MTDSPGFNGEEEIDPYGESFGDIDWVDPETNRESERLLEGVTRSIRQHRRRLDLRADLSMSEAAENAREMNKGSAAAITERLAELQVRGARNNTGVDLFTYRNIERFPELDIDLPLIDDVHYGAYLKERQKSPSPYITVSLDEIISELVMMHETKVNPVNFQRRQLREAREFFERLGVEEGSVYEVLSKPEGRMMVKSLHRFFMERPMGTFLRNFKKEQRGKMDERPIDLLSLAARAVKWFEIRYRENQALGIAIAVEDGPEWRSEFPDEEELHGNEAERKGIQMQRKQLNEKDPDQMRWYELRMCELNRARAFARPVDEYLANSQQIQTG